MKVQEYGISKEGSKDRGSKENSKLGRRLSSSGNASWTVGEVSLSDLEFVHDSRGNQKVLGRGASGEVGSSCTLLHVMSLPMVSSLLSYVGAGCEVSPHTVHPNIGGQPSAVHPNIGVQFIVWFFS